MKNKLLLQTGNILSIEKLACIKSDHECKYISYSNLHTDVHRNNVPIGSVEFVKRYLELLGIDIPKNFCYGFNENILHKFLKRKIIKTTYLEAPNEWFIKPVETKLFTGDIKDKINLKTNEEIWSSEPIEILDEFRFYINNKNILGYSRYDSLDCESKEINFEFVQEIINSDLNLPISYSIDIGWNDLIKEWCLIELNDAWSLGFYNNRDIASKPPTNENYVKMIVDRWNEIVGSTF